MTEALSREQDGVRITIDAGNGAVTVRTVADKEVDLASEREARVYDDSGPHREEAKENLRKLAQDDLENQAAEIQRRLRQEATDQLEAALADVRRELDQAVNRTTAEALKRKAAQLGQIKEMTDDPQTGSLTIVLEV